MLLAGTACLVMTVATSLRAARRRLRYESWHLLHLYAYLGVGLALPHQLWTGQEFLASTAATVFWWSLWALAAGAVSVHLTGRHLDRLPAQAGQFLTWRFLHRQGWPRGAPTSSPSTGAAGPVLPGHRRASDSWLGAGVGAADDVTALTWWVPDPGRARRVRLRPRGLDRDRAPRHPGGRPPSGPAPYREVQVVTWR